MGEVVGEYHWWSQVPDGPHLARGVRWLGAVPRSELRRPVHLQDPRLVFALRDEPALAAPASVRHDSDA